MSLSELDWAIIMGDNEAEIRRLVEVGAVRSACGARVTLFGPRCRLLVELGADVENAKHDSAPLLFTACSYGKKACAQLLMEHGADIGNACVKDEGAATHVCSWRCQLSLPLPLPFPSPSSSSPRKAICSRSRPGSGACGQREGTAPCDRYSLAQHDAAAFSATSAPITARTRHQISVGSGG